jgi:CxxC-x17-CxxC domain-containing protein
MGNFNRNDRPRGGRSGGGNDFRRRDSGPRQMYSAVCDNCGKNCEIPFRPSGDRPVYCSDCFEKTEKGGFQRSTRRDEGRPNFSVKDNTNNKMLDQMISLNSKMDKLISLMQPNVIPLPQTVEEIKKPEVKKTVDKKAKAEKPKVVKKTSSKASSKK